MNQRLIHTISAAIIILGSIAVYLNAVGGEFVWDDRDLIVDNLSLRDIGTVPYFF